jgi:hypothetical protein
MCGSISSSSVQQRPCTPDAKEPIIDDLVRVRAFNEPVAYIADLTQTNFPQIEAALLETD